MRFETSVFVTLVIGTLSMIVMARDFYIDFVEFNRMRMIFINNEHYAIYNPGFKANWQSYVKLGFSYNNGEVYILGLDNKTVTKNWSVLSKDEKTQAEETRKILNNIRSNGPDKVTGDLVRVSSYDLHGAVSSAGFGGKGSSSSMSVNGMAVSKSGDNEFVISKNDMPYKWVRLFIIDKIVGTVNADGIVLFNHMDSLTNEERTKLNEIMEPIKKMDSFNNNMMNRISNPFDFVSRAMGESDIFSYDVYILVDYLVDDDIHTMFELFQSTQKHIKLKKNNRRQEVEEQASFIE